MIDMQNEVYSKDKRDDIEMKLAEYEQIVNSTEERARLSNLGRMEREKVEAAQLKEKEKISAINY